ncbi:MAG TPA: TonB-dependent receptor [Rhodanobacteraceae bacterium]|nr:TonB-dependent receptor [Rhodanobacteraceae bacterium]
MKNCTRNTLPRRSTLAMALALGMGVSGFAFAQATTGTIFGNAPAAAGETVTVSSNNGVVRTVSVTADGSYTVANLPLGVYTVTLKKDGSVVGQHNNITIHVGAGSQVNFASASAQNAQNLGAVQVTANAMPSIDVTSVSSSTVITAQQLQKLPVGRSAESIALLSPGAVSGSGYFGNAVSFGGSSVSENAYYVNGYNTGDPFQNIGGFQLPYGSIAQQQTYTGGYSAKYGRSDGGVINQVGKRGTNEWHFGGQVSWAPRQLAAGGKDVYYPIENVPPGYKLPGAEKQGTLRRHRGDNKSWETIYSAYVGGPLIKDKLYAFFSVETSKDKYTSVSSNLSPSTESFYSDHSTRTYGKLDWNINANNILELTSLTSDETSGKGSVYNYDYDTMQATDFRHANDAYVNNAKFLIAKYTSYIGDNATLDVTWGRGEFENHYDYGINSKLPYIYYPQYQRGDGPGISNAQPRLYDHLPDASNSTHGLRADFTYQLGDHKLGIGIDNMYYSAHDQGQKMSGPGYMWMYLPGDANEPINEGLGVGAPGGDGYYVSKYIVQDYSSMSMEQKAYYIQDVWNVTSNFQLNLGLRNDHFTNYNNKGQAFVDQKNQWEPRIGFSWDVNGDSSLKIYGNAGRYYLALPDSVAKRAANPSIFTNEYFTYNGIDENGIPQNLKPVGGLNGAPAPGPVSSDHETGSDKDPRTVTATDLKAQYQDEFILGFDKTLGNNWVYGAKATYRILRTAIDDVCDPGSLEAKMTAMGLDTSEYAIENPGCRIFNPGRTNHFNVARKDGTGYADVAMSTSDWGFKQGAKRKYYALDLYLSHPFDGKWSGRIDYTFSRSWGNTEGQVKSDIGQDDISKTQDWDLWQLMDHSYGYLANHRRHQLKARGLYQITPEWMVSGVLRIQSGTPLSCLGYFGPDSSDPTGYGGGSYHWCNGQPVAPGSIGFSPWTRQLDLGVRYTPAFANQKLAFKLDVFNVLNEQKAIQVDPTYVVGKKALSNTYGMGQYFEQPRYVRLSVSYDY